MSENKYEAKAKANKMVNAQVPKQFKGKDLKFQTSDSIGSISSIPDNKANINIDNELVPRTLHILCPITCLCIPIVYRVTKVDGEEDMSAETYNKVKMTKPCPFTEWTVYDPEMKKPLVIYKKTCPLCPANFGPCDKTHVYEANAEGKQGD